MGNTWKRVMGAALAAALLLGVMPVPSRNARAVEKKDGITMADVKPLEMVEEEADLIITTADELAAFSDQVNEGDDFAGKLVCLTEDILFDNTVGNYMPAAEFSGTFDGRGHSISGINVVEDKYVGLFRHVKDGGIIRNVTVKDSRFTTMEGNYRRVGAIAGYNSGVIENCHNRNVTVEGRSAGGIAGCCHQTGIIRNCSSSGLIKAKNDSWAGGITADSEGQILNCCNLGDIVYSGSDDSRGSRGAGGIVGYAGESEIQNCYNAGSISDSSRLGARGGIAGFTERDSIVVSNFCAKEASVEKLIGGSIGSSPEEDNSFSPASEMKTVSFADELNANRGSNTDWLEWEIRTGESLYPLPVKLVYLSECMAETSIPVTVYDGMEKCPAPVISHDGKTMEQDKDYSVTYNNNVDAGTGDIMIEGQGRYRGSAILHFSIAQAEFSRCKVSFDETDIAYNGKPRTPDVTVKDGGRTLKPGTDYSKEYSDNIDPGTATLTLKGMRNYTGTRTLEFSITPADLSDCSITVDADDCIYNGKEQKPEVTVEDGNQILQPGTDYSVEYTDNVNVGTAQVSLTGIGNYTGVVTKEFTIKDVSNTGDGASTGNTGDGASAGNTGNGVVSGNTGNGISTGNTGNKNPEETGKISLRKQAVKSMKTLKGRKLLVSWNKDVAATGYQIQYSTAKNFKKGAKTVTISGNQSASKLIKKLKQGRKYYVRVRSCRSININGTIQKQYGAWSNAKKSGRIKK